MPIIEFEVTHKDGRKLCWTIRGAYELRGDEVSIEVLRIDFTKETPQ